MNKNKTQNAMLIAGAVLNLALIACFCLYVGLNYPKKVASYNASFFDNDIILLNKKYEIKKGSFDKLKYYDAKVSLGGDAFVEYPDLDECNLFPGEKIDVNETIGVKDDVHIASRLNGIVLSRTTQKDGKICVNIYNYNQYEIVLSLEGADFYQENFKTDTYFANINGQPCKLDFYQFKLDMVESSNIYSVVFKPEDKESIVTEYSIDGAYKIEKKYEDVYYLPGEAFGSSHMKKGFYVLREGKVQKIELICTEKISNACVLENVDFDLDEIDFVYER